jgi:hypothetical protein
MGSHYVEFFWGKQKVQVAFKVRLGVLSGWGGEDFAKLVDVDHRICVIGNNAAVGFKNKVFDLFYPAEGMGVFGIDRRLGLIEPELSVNKVIVTNETVFLFYSFL